MKTKSVNTSNNPITTILNDFKNQSNIESSNLLSYVKKNTIIAPTIDDTAPTKGPNNAPITIFEFSCYGCPASRDMQPVLKEVLAKYPDQIKLVWKDLPIPDLYPQADLSHLAARCANEQNKFWEYQEKLWLNQNNFSLENLQALAQEVDLNPTQFTDCLASKKFQALIDADVDEAAELSISGTPHFYINSQEIFGVATVEDFEIVINAELNR